MLSSLYIQNYALIASLQIQFDQGMTVITGETGAGKSIIMGALSLILGNRADTSILFNHSEKCVVEAVFDISSQDLSSFFEENNLDYQESTVVRREIAVSGKSRAFINDTPVTLPILKEFASQLIDIHSQHQNLLFQNADFRTDVVDFYAGIRNEVVNYQSVLEKMKTCEKHLDDLRNAQKARAEKQDFLQFVYNELEQARLQENEQEELEQNVDFLTHTETIKANLFQISQLLSESDNAALNALRDAKSLSSEISLYRSDIEELNSRIESNYIDLKDIVSDVSSLSDKIEFDPDELDRMRQRLDLLYGLEQKHHVTSVAQLIEKKIAVLEEITTYSTDEQSVSTLEAELQQLRTSALTMAQKLHKERISAAKGLQNDILKNIVLLGMPDAQFVINIEQRDILNNFGIDDIQFLFSANKGVPVAPLEKSASGGEISRIMLSVKSTLSDHSVLPTVVFDEIDVGISGEMAGKVAALMKQMAQKRQLLVITHLPQIAATGTSHYQVFKDNVGDTSHTQVKKLSANERIVEIAKMMSGAKWGDSALKAAQELIEQ